MHPILVVSSSRERLNELRTSLSDDFAADFLMLAELSHLCPDSSIVLDIDFHDADSLTSIQQWLRGKPGNGQKIVAIEDRTSRLELTQARALGATFILERPVTAEKLHNTLLLSSASDEHARPELPKEAIDAAAEFSELHDLFAAAPAGRAPDLKAATVVASQMVDKIAEIGLGDYLKVVRKHHDRTYKHCLSVTAIAIAFAQLLGFNRADIEKVALAGLFHDIGKALVPVEILEKSGDLTRDEIVLMRMHPEMGYQFLRGLPGLAPDILDMVLHHHEYLDGSGYPHQLKGEQISDLSRLITIADVYAALVEQRSYKPALSGPQAYRILQSMDAKLDAALVREFLPLSRV